ncbi:hypothetical protein BH10PLA2_BH10PLA2_38990 [soil metagenome]
MAPTHSRQGPDYPTLVLRAARNCETIRVALRCLSTIGTTEFMETACRKTIHLRARLRIAGEIQLVANLVRQAVDMKVGPEDSEEQRLLRLREMACFDQLLAAQETLNQELALLLTGRWIKE